MKKIPTVFQRDWSGDKSRVVNEPNAACIWVIEGEGWPTRKIDGTCCMVRDGRLYKRREIKPGQVPPADFEIADVDDETGKTVGWVPVGDAAEDRWHREAFDQWADMDNGTYELVGPKIQGNPEGHTRHELVSHFSLAMGEDVPRDFEGMKVWLAGKDIEGIVFVHPDGRMAKIKLRDFGLDRATPSRTALAGKE